MRRACGAHGRRVLHRRSGANEATGQVQQAVTTLDIANAVGNDDGEEAATTMNRGSATLDLNYDGTSANIVGLRFNGITVPQGTTISNAYIQLLPTSSPNSGAPTVTIKAQASDNAPTLAGTASYMSTLATTTASVSWAPANFTASVADANSKPPSSRRSSRRSSIAPAGFLAIRSC